MILGSLLLELKPRYLIGLTILLAVGMELLVPDPNSGQPESNPLINLFLYSGGDVNFWVNYPILAWLELVTLGMVFGHWFVNDPKKAFRRALYVGLVFLAAFVVVRYLDGFIDALGLSDLGERGDEQRGPLLHAFQHID